MRLYRRAVDEEPQERQLNIHLDPENLAGVYANFANVSFSDYEFTLTFARIDHEVEEGDVPGVVVARINMSPRFMRELHRRDERQLVEVVHARGDQEPAGAGLSRVLNASDRHPDALHRGRVRAEEEVRPGRRVGVAERRDGQLLLEADEALRGRSSR